MKTLLLVSLVFTLSGQTFGATCVDTYIKIVKDNQRGAKENIGDAMVVGALSSTVAIVSFGTGGPGLMLTGLASFAASGYLGTNEKEKRAEAQAVLNLIKDSKVKSGYYLRDATRMIQGHFQDPSITESEVAEHILKLDSKMSYCSGDKVQGLSGVLMSVGKSIIVTHATVSGKNIYDKQRNTVEKSSVPDSAHPAKSSNAVDR